MGARGRSDIRKRHMRFVPLFVIRYILLPSSTPVFPRQSVNWAPGDLAGLEDAVSCGRQMEVNGMKKVSKK